MPNLIETEKICKDFQIGSSKIQALRNIDFHANKGDFAAIMGASGSGKSTLLYILGCLDRPTSGTYFLNGQNVSHTTDRELSHIRASRIGFIFQTFNLLPQLNIYENVEVPFLYGSFDGEEIEERVIRAIRRVGLLNRLKHRPSELSGGEMQRVAIARAICIDPVLILADEPTGNLDSQSGIDILRIFEELHDHGATILLVTHAWEVAAFAGRKLTLRDGQFIET
ncbi:MAG: ABC transporter ATP-binding protein [Deltaproteobacteria bacterium]|nr:ABC transporter ATP-binding protein [Deltaproteobacteria bacterium]